MVFGAGPYHTAQQRIWMVWTDEEPQLRSAFSISEVLACLLAACLVAAKSRIQARCRTGCFAGDHLAPRFSGDTLQPSLSDDRKRG
ncbi:hypothetical protein C8R47DRAFT_1215591 [Mycena vitilis]|nr:hypothetical protein C8R47DRAFT_1215591 [Mycena vitilis]